MAAPITLGITIRADGSAQVTGEVNRVLDSVNNLGNTAQNSSRQFAEMAGKLKALVGIGFATAMATEIFKVNREMQSLRTSLETITGSASNAQAAFKQIQAFAASTPYSVKEVTDAFVKLSTFGLRAGESDLTSYGNTAGAMGKSLNQLVEAVADAVTGEFERLKEFGIKSSAHGDKVTFTFKGIETTVKNSSTAIQDYLKHIGDVDFAGGMARQAKTIDGAMSNLGDSWNNLLDTLITTAGEEWIAGLISGLSDVINSVGNVGKAMVSFGGITASTGTYVQAAWMTISETANSAMQSVLESFPLLPTIAKASLDFTMEVFKS